MTTDQITYAVDIQMIGHNIEITVTGWLGDVAAKATGTTHASGINYAEGTHWYTQGRKERREGIAAEVARLKDELAVCLEGAQPPTPAPVVPPAAALHVPWWRRMLADRPAEG